MPVAAERRDHSRFEANVRRVVARAVPSVLTSARSACRGQTTPAVNPVETRPPRWSSLSRPDRRWSSLSRPELPGGRPCRDQSSPAVNPVETRPLRWSSLSRPDRAKPRSPQIPRSPPRPSARCPSLRRCLTCTSFSAETTPTTSVARGTSSRASNPTPLAPGPNTHGDDGPCGSFTPRSTPEWRTPSGERSRFIIGVERSGRRLFGVMSRR